MEGPIALTECNREADGCGIQDSCLAHRHWLVINQAVREALAGIRLADLAGLALSPGGLGDAVAAMTFFDRYPPG